MPDAAVISDGSLSFGGGVNSVKVTTVQSEQVPDGLGRSELAWLINGAVRDGGISPRGPFQFRCRSHSGDAFYQGGWMYEPVDGSETYLVCSIGGRIWKFGISDCSKEEISRTRLVPSFNPATSPSVTLKNNSGKSFDTMIPAGSVINSSPPIGTTALDFTVPFSGFDGKLVLTANAPVIVGDTVIFHFPLSPPLDIPFQVTAITVSGTPPDLTDLVLRNDGGQQSVVGTTIPAGQPIDSRYPQILLTQDFVIPAFGLTATAHLNAVWPVNIIGQFFGPSGVILAGVGRNAPASPPAPPTDPLPINPSDVEEAFFCQAEQFLIIQAGDGVTLPLFWDGSTLRRSIGINNTAVAPGTPGINELPAATAMDYFMGRLWYAQGTQYSAGDIVKGKSGTLKYNFKDAILNVTENPLVLGGDGFSLPDNAGNIRALKHNANQDSALGQGLLFIFTRKVVAALQVPVTRTNWINATDANQPLQTIIQLVNGSVNDRAVVAVNGDLYYQSLEPGIRSLLSAIRYFNQPGNRQISANETRVLQFVDRGLLRFMSGIEFDNRLLECTLPKRFPNGVVGQAIIPMDFIPVSSFGSDVAPVWEGMYEGLDSLQLFTGTFGGVQRAFSFVRSRLDGSFNIWEILRSGSPIQDVNENGDNRITMVIEFPAYTWNREFLLKRIASAEFWIDRLFGTVDFTLEFRPDGDPCWHFWTKWEMCSARNCTESVYHPCDYPVDLKPFGQSYRATMTTAKPPGDSCASVMGRPSDILYQCQTRLTVKGYCRIRGELLKAFPVERALWSNNVN